MANGMRASLILIDCNKVNVAIGFITIGYVTRLGLEYPTGCTGELYNDKMQTHTHAGLSGIGLQPAPSIGKYSIVVVRYRSSVNMEHLKVSFQSSVDDHTKYVGMQNVNISLSQDHLY